MQKEILIFKDRATCSFYSWFFHYFYHHFKGDTSKRWGFIRVTKYRLPEKTAETVAQQLCRFFHGHVLVCEESVRNK